LRGFAEEGQGVWPPGAAGSGQ